MAERYDHNVSNFAGLCQLVYDYSLLKTKCGHAHGLSEYSAFQDHIYIKAFQTELVPRLGWMKLCVVSSCISAPKMVRLHYLS